MATKKPAAKQLTAAQKGAEALKILAKIVNEVDDSVYEDLCSEGKHTMREAAKLVGEKRFVAGEVVLSLDTVEVSFDDIDDDDVFEAVLTVTNKRTSEVQSADVYIYDTDIDR
jgi:hypothetical protein